ncbi:MAG: helix-turn-helix transcriptional regulator [Oscillospiraceae bacterium]|nr:helix-turn-helix transcriptional regulator [Oscillospiraceae bacterium]
MNIIISENLKELRKKKNNTQEDLAEFLTVSSAAVSKWERGECYPDIEFLPKIASYYNISMDDLFGMGEIKKKERIDEYLAKDYEISLQEKDRTEQSKKRIALWREAQKEFPNNHVVLLSLVYALNYPHWLASDHFEEIVQIGERLLAESTDTYIRFETIYTLCNACAMKKDFENAKRYANMTPSYLYSREVLYGRCLTGEERIEYRQRCIVYFIRDIYKTFIQDLYGYKGGVFDGGKFGEEGEVAKMCEFALSLFQLLYPDSDFGEDEHWVAAICNVLTNQYSGVDNEKALYYLDETANHYVKYYTQGEFKHTSFMVNRLTYPGYNRPKDVMQKSVMQDIEVIEKTADLAYIRNDERYTAAMEKLKNLVK